MTDESNAERITPVDLAGVGADDGLQVAPSGPPQMDPSNEFIASSIDSAKPELEPGINDHAMSEQNNAAIEGSQGPDSQDEKANQKNEDDASNVNPVYNVDDKPYSVFTHNEKRIIILCTGLSQFFSPISSQIYFPSLDAIASDLHVSSSLVNLTITVYLVSDYVRSRPEFTY